MCFGYFSVCCCIRTPKVFSLMIGILQPNKGQILWKGDRIRRWQRGGKMSLIPQKPAQYFLGRTIMEELLLGRAHVTPDQVRSALLSVGLGNISLLKAPRELSGGQMKRLAIAAQLLRTPRPELILLDEPFAGVDRKSRRDIAELLVRLQAESAIGIISHEPSELLMHADRVIQLAHGHLIEVDQGVLKRAKDLMASRART